jgi:ribonuclease P protein subunit RPP14
VKAFERQILTLPSWQQFSIWGAGRDGKLFYRNLTKANQQRVQTFLDIPESNKLGHKYENVPIRHWNTAATAGPLVLCVALDRTQGQFEANLQSFNLVDGKDYFQFA